MQRVTVTVDDSLMALAKADVTAGRASSLSAWVADAMRRKALARAELPGRLAQVWRGGSRQARLARLLGSGTVDE